MRRRASRRVSLLRSQLAGAAAAGRRAEAAEALAGRAEFFAAIAEAGHGD
eukprot:gene5961-2600_t